MLRTIAIVSVLNLFGCSEPARDRCMVEGSARFQGQPLEGYSLTLYSEQTGGGGADIRADGTFRFPGPMQEGEYVVYFTIPTDVKGAAREKAIALNLPEKYRKPQTSDQRITLKPGPNKLDLELMP